MSKECKICFLTEEIPGADIDKSNLCKPCRIYLSSTKKEIERMKTNKREEFSLLIQNLKRDRHKRKYDALLLLSGGKDSAYLAYLLKEKYGLHILAYTEDNGFLSPIARRNTKTIIKRLKLPHIFKVLDNEFIRKTYIYAMLHPDPRGTIFSVCGVCSQITHITAIKVALEYKIPVIFNGFSPGQPEFFFYEFPVIPLREEGLIDDELWDEIYNEKDRENYLDSIKIKIAPKVISPLHVLEYNMDKISLTVIKKGIIKRFFVSPLITNCLLIPFMLYIDTVVYGYNPYVWEFSILARMGAIKKRKWKFINRLLTPFSLKNLIPALPFRYAERKLGITAEYIMKKRKERPIEIPAKYINTLFNARKNYPETRCLKVRENEKHFSQIKYEKGI